MNNDSEATTTTIDKVPQPSPDITRSNGSCDLRFALKLSADVLFVLGSILYLWLAVVGFQYYEEEIIRNATIPDEVWEADDWTTWDPYLHLWNDDTVFTTHGHYVSKYQILYFAAACCFVLTGVIDFVRFPGPIPVVFIAAGGFGVTSAVYVDVDNYLAALFNSISVHLFMVEAFFLLFFRQTFYGWVKHYVRLGDFFWVGGTLVDVVLSYFAVFETYEFRHQKVAIFAACLWLSCSLIYISSTLYVRYWDPSAEPANSEASTSDEDEPYIAGKAEESFYLEEEAPAEETKEDVEKQIEELASTFSLKSEVEIEC